MSYKQDFIVWTLVVVGWFTVTIVFYQILYFNVSEISGWSKDDMLLLQGVFFVFNWILWGILWPNMREIPIKINKGQLDLELVRPINTQFLLSFKNIGLENFNEGVLGVGMIVYVLSRTGVYPNLWQIGGALVAIIFGAIFVYAGYFITMCYAFFTQRIENLGFLFPSVREVWKFPYTFYQGAIRVIFTFVLPITLVTSTPVGFLLKKPSYWHLSVLIVSSVLFLKLSNMFFKFSLKRYSGASA